MKFNILHLTPDFNYADGRSYYVYLLLKYLGRRGHKVFLGTNGGNSFDRIDELSVPVFKSDSLSKKSAFLKSAKFISGIIEKHDINIVHTHHRYYEMIANSLRKEKNVHTVFTSLSLVDRRFFVEYRSDRIIAVSNTVKEMLTGKFNVDEKRIDLIPNFVDSEESDSAIDFNFKKSKETCLLAVGRFHKEKDFMTLLEAMSLLKNYKLKLIMIGEGEERNAYERFISENSINAEIFPPQRNLKEFYEKADICILTSLRDPLPGFMLQSGLQGKPFIGSDVDGISELIINNENGLTFRRNDPQDLADKIKIYLEDTALAGKCAERLHELVKEKFTEKSVIPQIEKLYMNLFDTI